jgi:hypothetical protein
MSSPIPPPISIAAPRPNNWPAARSRYTAAQLQRNALPTRHHMHWPYKRSRMRWPYKRSRMRWLLATPEALVQRGGRVANKFQLLNPNHQSEREARS